MIHSNVGSGVSSVLAFRGNGAVDDNSQYGDRAPAIFYYKTGYLHFTNAVNGNGNYHFNYEIELNKLYHIEIAQEEKNEKVFYTVKVDGVTIKSVENTDPRTFKDVRVFAGDNFYPPTDGSYSNLIWESFPRCKSLSVSTYDFTYFKSSSTRITFEGEFHIFHIYDKCLFKLVEAMMAMFFSLPVTAAMDLRLLSEAGPTSTQRSGNLSRRM